MILHALEAMHSCFHMNLCVFVCISLYMNALCVFSIAVKLC